ncbi:alpha/beta fold hydrolase [Chitinophaga varians]|uniref:alpha/beta fold hydrolase n=1 Tax=Chitinophaga varians TaxID=2202339 RepID=UPI00165FF78F|nr:alpha/beta hydrolase [Chitinophaga varians]MBC9909393.1 alpha/beta hydrolase [Chitinophaga varians]
MQPQKVFHRTIPINGLDIFYREAGDPVHPAILLMHGFPSSSHMFRRLLPALAQAGYYAIAPDFPGFGYSTYPTTDGFAYTFENFAHILSSFVEQMQLRNFALYLHDYGSTIGMRVALQHPEKISALIFQDGNSYEEGLGKEWDTAKAYWDSPTAANKAQLPEWLNAEGTRQQYVAGVPEAQLPLFSPDNWALDWALMDRPGHVEAQFALFEDYRDNRKFFPLFQEFFRRTQLPALVIWGKYDAYFSVAEASCYTRDLPHAEVHILDAGHKALESHFEEISPLVLDFLRRELK